MEPMVRVEISVVDSGGTITTLHTWTRECVDLVTASQVAAQAETSLDVLGLVRVN